MSPALALEVLRLARLKSSEGTQQTVEVRVALLMLRRFAQDVHSLDLFWAACGEPHPIGRGQTLTSEFNGVLRCLGLPRWLADGGFWPPLERSHPRLAEKARGLVITRPVDGY
jgi:hypothetical protein